MSLTSRHTKSASLCKPAPSAQTSGSDKTIVIHTSSKNGAKTPRTGPAGPGLSDHMDMARPPHENPEYTGTRAHILPGPATIISGPGASIQQWTAGKEAGVAVTGSGTTTATKVITASPASLNSAEVKSPGTPGPVAASSTAGVMHAVPIAIPITTFTIASGQHVSITRVTGRGVFFVRIPTTKSILFLSLRPEQHSVHTMANSLYYCVLIIVIIAVTWQIYPAVAQALHRLPQVAAEEAPG